MFAIVCRITAGAALLLIMPVSVWIFGWIWHPGQYIKWMKELYWITETVVYPWGVIIHVLFCAWFLWCLRLKFPSALMMFIIFCTTILAGQEIKFLLKNGVKEPRPFILWMEKTNQISLNTFYNLRCKGHSQQMTQLAHSENIPNFLRKYWQKETGFSFPSGHTIFVTSWALLGTGLLWSRRHTVTIVVLLIYATIVMGSRLLLGMHWPKDLIVSTFISWLLVICALLLEQRLRSLLPLLLKKIKHSINRNK